MCALSPLAVIVAEVLVDGGFQLKEVLLHCSPDGSLNYPEKTNNTISMCIFFFTVCDEALSLTKKGHFPHITSEIFNLCACVRNRQAIRFVCHLKFSI